MSPSNHRRKLVELLSIFDKLSEENQEAVLKYARQIVEKQLEKSKKKALPARKR